MRRRQPHSDSPMWTPRSMARHNQAPYYRDLPMSVYRSTCRSAASRCSSLPRYLCNRYIDAVATPLREPTFLILAALARAPLHGYGLITEVAELSGGALELRPGTLYGALDRLSDDGLVALDRQEIVDGRVRKYYRLTERGDAALQAETERLRRTVEAATRRLADRASTRPAGGMVSAAGTGGRHSWEPPARPAIGFAGAVG